MKFCLYEDINKKDKLFFKVNFIFVYFIFFEIIVVVVFGIVKIKIE